MKRFLAFSLAAFLAGCGGGAALQEPRTFDLGLIAPGPALPPVRLGMVRAAAPFDGTEMHYRLIFRNPAEIAAFANSRWAASPADMLRRQMLRSSGEKTGRCVLDLEIHEFTQAFTSEKSSEARIELHAWLAGASGRIAQRGWSMVEPNAGADAAAGAGAFARAADRAIGELGRWIGGQKDCN